MRTLTLTIVRLVLDSSKLGTILERRITMAASKTRQTTQLTTQRFNKTTNYYRIHTTVYYLHWI